VAGFRRMARWSRAPTTRARSHAAALATSGGRSRKSHGLGERSAKAVLQIFLFWIDFALVARAGNSACTSTGAGGRQCAETAVTPAFLCDTRSDAAIAVGSREGGRKSDAFAAV
jgi:hypothetical protein